MVKNVKVSFEVNVRGALGVQNNIEETLDQLESEIDTINSKIKKYEKKIERNEFDKLLSEDQINSFRLKVQEEKRKILTYQETLESIMIVQNKSLDEDIKNDKIERKRRKYKKLLRALDSS